jgi:hypothetical protein
MPKISFGERVEDVKATPIWHTTGGSPGVGLKWETPSYSCIMSVIVWPSDGVPLHAQWA